MSPHVSQFRILRSLGLLCCCSMISLVLCQSYDYGLDVAQALKAKRQSQGNIIITTGMPLSRDGTVPVRPEIRDLQQDPDKWSLYILALDMMQYTAQSSPTSWYSITGIHGVPFQAWNGVQPTPGNENSGYCHHQDILFPTWHRAYVAMYEQELCGLVHFIATLYSDGNLKTRMEAAAADCRAPYFDWAALPPSGDSMLPAGIGDNPWANVSGPTGAQIIANPLFTYAFDPPDPSVFFNITPWADWPGTRRAPTSLAASALSNNSAINLNLGDHIVSIQQRLYNLFSNYDDYTIFSNEGWPSDSSQYDSLESLHDNVHALLGGNDGHMTIVPFSAFDPLFFLHHAMVDRLFAMWQVIHPNSWITPQVAKVNSYTTSVGQILDSSSSLTPFYASSNGTFWNSDMLRDPTNLGYTYPELVGLSLSNMTSILAGRSRVASSINKLYGRYGVNSLSLQNNRSEHLTRHSRHRISRPYAGHRRESTTSLPLSKIISQQGQYREWIANIRVTKQALDGPFSVRLALGLSTHAGAIGVFASPPALAKMMQMAPGAGYISSAVPLTAALVDKVSDGTLSSMEPEVVGPFLQQFLAVHVVNSDGSEVDPPSVPGLSVKVISAMVQATLSEEHLPTWGEVDYDLAIL